MKTLITVLIMLLLLLQYKLWFEGGGVKHVWQLEQAVHAQAQENELLKQRNLILEAEIKDLKQGQEAIEERARNDLGMVKKNETYYQVIEKAKS